VTVQNGARLAGDAIPPTLARAAGDN
jgi:hypothetical protein